MVSEIIGVGARLEERGVLAENARLIAQELGACGITVGGQTAVGVQVQKLRASIARALERSEVVILVGGLGAGPDGITKETVCEGLGRRLVPHEDSLRRIREAYERAGRQMPQQVKKLAMLPEKSTVFPGVRGITPGCALSAGSQFILMIPEKPEEFLPMFKNSILPYLAKFTEAAVATHVVNAAGLDPEQAKARLGKLLELQNPVVALTPKAGELQIRVTARSQSKAEASALANPVVDQVKEALGAAVYGVDARNLQSVTVQALTGVRLTVSMAEACTGGQLAELLTSVPGAEKTVRYGISAGSNKVKLETLKVPEKLLKKHGAVSAAAAAAMAFGAQEQGDSALGLAITGSAGGKGDEAKLAGTVYIALCDRAQAWVEKLDMPKNTDPALIRHTACVTAMNLLRKYAQTLGKMPGAVPRKDALAGKAVPSQTQGGPQGKKRPWYAALLPVKGDAGAEIARKSILIVAVLVFVCSAGYLVNFKVQAERNKAQNAGLSDLITAGDNEEAIKKLEESGDGYPKDYQKKFAALYSINRDVAGWLTIADTQVNYAVVHYSDNEYYLRRDFYKKNNKHGIPWLEAGNSMDPQDDNYVIYGHNMTDGQMFGELMKYKPSGMGLPFLKEHSEIAFDDVYRDNKYKIISVFITNAKAQYGDIFYYNTMLDLSKDADFDTFVEGVRARSYYNSDIDVKKGDKFLTLSTCSYEFGPVSDDAHVRTVVVARRVRDGENLDHATYSYNPDPLMPQGFVEGQKQKEAAASKAASEAAASKAASEAAASSEAAAQASSGGAAASASSMDSSSVAVAEGEQGEMETIALQKLSRAQDARAQAEKARKSAGKYADDAYDADTYDRAKKYADEASYEADVARDAYYTASDAYDDIQSIHDDYPSEITKKALSDAKKAMDAAEEAWEEAKGYASDAKSSADSLKGNSSSSSPSSSSSEESSSSNPESTPNPPSSSSADTPGSNPESTPNPPSSSSTDTPGNNPESTPNPPPNSSEQPSSNQDTPSEPSSASEPSSEPAPSEQPAASDGADGENGGAGPANNEGAAPAGDSGEGGEAQGAQVSALSPRAPILPQRTRVLATTSAKKGGEKLTIYAGGKKLRGKASSIVAQVVMNEMGPGFEDEAIKAQAVAAYTFIRHENKAGRVPYLGAKKASADIQKLVNSVIGKAVYYKGKLAFTPFHGTSAGVTISSEDVWGGSYPYLVSVDSEIDEEAKGYEQSVTLRANAVADKVDAKLGIDLYDYSDDPDDWFEIEEYTEGDRYIKKLRVGDGEASGRVMREQVLGLRSAAFDISYRKGKFTFTTYGYGHGVGMSQTGANLYAAEGWSYKDILLHYYPGCRVK